VTDKGVLHYRRNKHIYRQFSVIHIQNIRGVLTTFHIAKMRIILRVEIFSVHSC
jgi:hypothetical protein